MKISSRVIQDIKQNKISSPQKKETSTEVLDNVTISSEKEEVSDDDFKNFLSKGFQKVVDYTKARPDTTGDSAEPSYVGAAMGGGLSGWFGGGHIVNSVGGMVGGAVGLKVGEKTESISKAVGASFVAGAAANTAAVTGLMLAESAITGATAVFNPVGMAVIAAVGGLSGVVGTMEGNCVADIKDRTTGGLMMGGLLSVMVPGATFIPMVGALASSAGPILAESKTGSLLVSAGTGAVLGAATGIIGGPVGMAVNAVLGAAAGVAGNLIGPKFSQVLRNAVSDIQKGTVKFFRKLFGKYLDSDKFGVKSRVAMGAAGGALSFAPMALIGSLIAGSLGVAGPIGAVIPVVIGAAMMGKKVYDKVKIPERAKEYKSSVKDFFSKTLPKEYVDSIPEQAIDGFSLLFAQKYKKKDFSKLTAEQFIKDVQDFERQAAEAAARAAQAQQAAPQEQAAV